jgi:chitin synthase
LRSSPSFFKLTFTIHQPLILLACILGLPGLLIIVTSRKIAYVGWMLIYLCSLPIWNAVLPTYAYFHMDDFSWGSTRKIHGEDKAGSHDDKEGEFDSQSIIMKRWAEWERERRWKSGTRSRDSTFDVLHRTGSPHHSNTTRNSVISTDTFVSQGGMPQDPFFRGATTPSGYSSSSPVVGSRRQVDNVQVLELPAPLAVTHQPQQYQHTSSQSEATDSADPSILHNYEASPYQSSSSENFHPNPSPVPRAEEE